MKEEVFLAPKRGKKYTGISKNIILKKGEVFFEYPDSGVGTGIGSIKMGDGISQYKDLSYFLNIKDIIGNYITNDFISDNDNTKGTVFRLNDDKVINFKNNLNNGSVEFTDTNDNLILGINVNGTISIREENGNINTFQDIVSHINVDGRYYTKQEIENKILTNQHILENVVSYGIPARIKVTKELIDSSGKKALCYLDGTDMDGNGTDGYVAKYICGSNPTDAHFLTPRTVVIGKNTSGSKPYMELSGDANTEVFVVWIRDGNSTQS